MKRRDPRPALFIVEPNKQGSEHLSFNAAMLSIMIRAAFEQDREAIFFCNATHRDRLQAQLSGEVSVTWRKIPVVNGLTRNFIKKFAVEVFVLFRILLEARRKGADVLLLSVFPNALACILLFKKLFRRVRLHVILHGELESLVIPEKWPVYREGFWVKLALLRAFDGSWPVFYVLGQGIRDRLLERFPAHTHLSGLRVIEHPFLFTSDRPDVYQKCRPYKVGFVGVGRLVKGIDVFFQLADVLSDCISAGTVELCVVGGIDKGVTQPIPRGVRILSNRPAGMGAKEFAHAIGELDHAVFLSRHNYLFTASGAVFDVLNQGVEIFSLENHYLRDLSRNDPEGGIKFFGDVREIELEIRSRLDTGASRPRTRRSYSQIKWRHSSGAQAAIAAEVLRT
jgi:hypothetical protein